jgi:hypothetical protein
MAAASAARKRRERADAYRCPELITREAGSLATNARRAEGAPPQHLGNGWWWNGATDLSCVTCTQECCENAERFDRAIEWIGDSQSPTWQLSVGQGLAQHPQATAIRFVREDGHVSILIDHIDDGVCCLFALEDAVSLLDPWAVADGFGPVCRDPIRLQLVDVWTWFAI